MTLYDKALARAEEKGVIFINDHNSNDMPAVGMRLNDDMAVFINERAFKNDKERRCAVVHEVKHCEMDSFYNESTPKWIVTSIKRRVTKATAIELVSFDKVVRAYKEGIFDEHEQAEEWDIPVQYVKIVHDAYEELYPDKVNELKLYVAENFNHYA